MNDEAGAERWADARAAIALFAVAPQRLGGLALRGDPGPVRDRLLGWLNAALPAGTPSLRLPVNVTDDRLLGGLSLVATLREGKPVAERGVLARADGGIVLAAMAERLASGVTAQLCKALDDGEVAVERDGIAARNASRIGVVALDEGRDDEKMSPSLLDRLAFHVDLAPLALPLPDLLVDAASVTRATELFPRVLVGADVVEALCRAALALGVVSIRAPLFAATAACARAALEGRTHIEEADVVVAARLVLGPRATQMPAPAEEEGGAEAPPDETPDADPAPASPPAADRDANESTTTSSTPAPIDDVILEAAKSGIPAGLLDMLVLGRAPRSSSTSRGHAGVARRSPQGGRPAGVRVGAPGPGERLNVVETLRAAAPWQTLRRAGRASTAAASSGRRRIEVRKEDFRIRSFEERAETRIVFAVDASGSAALQRLAEAKGAVERVLADCYVRRDHVALIAFRQSAASLLLPPTRSLTRVKRTLANLSGGGTTPLAAGIDAALALALEGASRGATPVIVLMTDGRANVGRGGRQGSADATVDALAAARAVRASRVRALFLDTSPRPRPQARLLAEEMGARYLPLPYVDDSGIASQVRSLAREGR